MIKNDVQPDAEEQSAAAPSFNIKDRLAMLAINYFSTIQLAFLLAILIVPYDLLWRRILYGLISLYMLPPLAARLMQTVFRLRQGRVVAGSRDFLVWWTIFNLQAFFCRFGVFEELLRVVPGLYSAWLRLWGAKIGRLTYWASGMVILDRSFISVGDDVIFGAGVRLNPHVLIVNDAGEKELLIATVKIGNNAMIGGYSLLTAGSEIADGECVRACLVLPPFSRWENGKRIKLPHQGAECS